MSAFQKNDRVKYTGPVINKDWDPEREGTVIGVSERIDIKWDHGPVNYSQVAEGYSRVDDMTVMGSVPTDDDQPSYGTRHDIDEIAQQLMKQVEFIGASIEPSTDPAMAYAKGQTSGVILRARQALFDLVSDRNATQRALDHFKKAVEDAPHSPGCATEDHRRKYEYPACDCWKSKEAL